MRRAEPKKYQQRRPEETVLYRVIQQHLESFLQQAHESSGKKRSPYAVPFQQLPEEIKSDNRAAATRIPEVLSLIGLRIVPRRQLKEAEVPRRPLSPEQVASAIEPFLEVLAEAEHDRWMHRREREDWRKGERNDDNRIHPRLVPYAELPDDEKDKDRSSVRHFSKILDLAGYAIVQP